jgi:stage V sporulation protein R
MTPALERRFDEIEELARKRGLDFFPVLFEEVPREVIWEVASYGLPTRMSHWSFGRTYLHQKTRGEMGYAKIFELVLNNNPSYAFLDDTNPDVINLLVVAHVLAHSDFFKNNQMFSSTNRNMVNQAERNAKTIWTYKEKYGIEEVEEWMDVAFSIDRHIDPNLGENRSKYPPMEHVYRTVEPLPYADLFGEADKRQVVVDVKNRDFPPHPERDLVWFLVNYGQMMPWQREILSIIRSESYYFYPQGQTKIMNEGWASYWHAELLLQYDGLTAGEHLDFSKAHSSVVSSGPPGQLNPYYLGFRLFADIKKRWDEAYEEGKKDKTFLDSEAAEKYDEKGRLVASKRTGDEKIFEVRRQDCDYSFISNYLTAELADDMKLFTYGETGNQKGVVRPEEDDIILKDRDLGRIKDLITSRLHNNGVPPISVMQLEKGTLCLHHEDTDPNPLDKKYAHETLKYVSRAWGGPVTLTTRDGDEFVVLSVEKGGVAEEETRRVKFDI